VVLHPSEYCLIIEMVCPILLVLSPFADSNQMKALHPRFKFHTGDWLTRHFLINHCQVMSKSFATLGDDPEIKIYQDYRNRLKQDFKKRQVYPPTSRVKGTHRTRPMDEVRSSFQTNPLSC